MCPRAPVMLRSPMALHGSSDARAIRSAVKQAMAYVEADVVGEIENSIEYMAL